MWPVERKYMNQNNNPVPGNPQIRLDAIRTGFNCALECRDAVLWVFPFISSMRDSLGD